MRIIDEYLARKNRDYSMEQQKLNQDSSSENKESFSKNKDSPSKQTQIGLKNPFIHKSLYESQKKEDIYQNEAMHQSINFVLYLSKENQKEKEEFRSQANRQKDFINHTISQMNDYIETEEYMKDLMRSAFEK